MTSDFVNHAIEVQGLILIRSIWPNPWSMFCMRVPSVHDDCYAIWFFWTSIHNWRQSVSLTGSTMFLVILLILYLAGSIIKIMIDDPCVLLLVLMTIICAAPWLVRYHEFSLRVIPWLMFLVCIKAETIQDRWLCESCDVIQLAITTHQAHDVCHANRLLDPACWPN